MVYNMYALLAFNLLCTSRRILQRKLTDSGRVSNNFGDPSEPELEPTRMEA